MNAATMNSATMTSSGAVTFLFSYASIALSILVLIVTAGLCFYAWRRSGYRRDYGLIELLRFVIAVFAIVLFNQPEWVEQFKPKEKPAVAILWDNSRSMDTRDVGGVGKATVTAKTEDPHPSPLPKGEGTFRSARASSACRSRALQLVGVEGVALGDVAGFQAFAEPADALG
jgi:hypothetical protein